MHPNPPGATPARRLRLVVGNDIHKTPMEENRPGLDRSAQPGLDSHDLPDKTVAVAQDALGARVDTSKR